MIQYLYPDHSVPAYFIRHEGNLIPRGIYEANPAAYGLVAHHTADGTPPYTDWELIDGEYHRELAGTPEERAAAELAQWRATAEVTALQGMLAIQSAGAVAGFNAWKASLDPIDDFAAVAFFEKAPTWKRDNPYLIQGATALGMTDEQIDQLFVLAETL